MTYVLPVGIVAGMQRHRATRYFGLCAIALAMFSCASSSDSSAAAADAASQDTVTGAADVATMDDASVGEDATVDPDTAPPLDAEVLEDTADSDTVATDVDGTADAADAVVLPPAEAFAALEAAWCPGYAALYCAAGEGCGCPAAPGYPTGAACEKSFVAQCKRLLGAYEPAVLSGQAVVDMGAVPDCLDRIGLLAESCVTLPSDSFFNDCPILAPPGGLPPLPAEGQPCAEGGQCALGLRCGALGVCEPPGAIDAPCTGPMDCDASLRCSAGKCAETDLSGVGKACAPDGDCGELVCAASSHRVCQALVAGASCMYDEGCLTTEYCAAGTCTPFPALGALCANGVGCTMGLGCDDTGHCAALPGDGKACALGLFGPLLCAPGTTCKDGLCGPIPGKDDPCAQGVPACGPGLGCAFGPDGSFCRTPGPAGTYCENDPTCADGLYCEFTENACRPWVAFGGPCSAGNECGSAGACLPDDTFTFRCAPIPAAGEACFLFDCGPGLQCVTPYTEGACVSGFCNALKF